MVLYRRRFTHNHAVRMSENGTVPFFEQGLNDSLLGNDSFFSFIELDKHHFLVYNANGGVSVYEGVQRGSQ